MNNITLSPLNKNNIKKVVQIEESCFSLPWSEESFDEELEQSNSEFWVAYINDEVVGYIGSQFILDEVFVTNVAVAQNMRKNGIATALFNKIIDLAHLKNMVLITLEVRISNMQAIRLYEKLGFISLGERKNFYAFPTENAFIMTKYFDGRKNI